MFAAGLGNPQSISYAMLYVLRKFPQILAA
jgi:hypothetical protein